MDALERPRCECHGEPMVQPSHWRCAISERQRASRWREANSEKMNEYRARWREANREKLRESARRYYEANREETLARHRANQRARRVMFYVGGIKFSRYVDNKGEVLAARDAFRAQQRADYRRAADVGFN